MALNGQPLSPTGYNLGGAPFNHNPFWDFDEGGGTPGTEWEFGHGLKVQGNVVSVNTVSSTTVGDQTLPMTAAGVNTIVGNIEVLLEGI